MNATCIQPYEQIEDDPYWVDLIERAWAEPIPEGLSMIGGLDGRGWARLCRAEDEGPGFYVGQYRDAVTRYSGLWRLARERGQPEQLPSDATVIESYYLSAFTNGSMLIQSEVLPGRPYAFLVPADPTAIEMAPIREE
ncbi:hypothetical protein [Jannaschia marina]|uniref:hypothetical protein n=1 Tax=Jannaschia marina TaxID=2741674 RepID=UPI0015C91424|nr:hypothetical protein [Jannaschia marina]